MESISFKLEVFEGPLDLLLSLIAKHKLNICDIEISKLLEQYLLYIDQAHEQNLELAGEFLEMAARLIYIKTASLLPQPEEAEQMKRELEGALIEYSLCKIAAQRLADAFVGGSIFVRRPMKIKADMTYTLVHEPERLAIAYSALSLKNIKSEHAKLHVENKINSVVKRRIVSVMTKVVHILRELYLSGEVYMDKLYDGVTDRSERVATFLAVLELTRHGRITISDDNMMIFFKGRKNGVKKTWRSRKSSEQ
ncbi:MAG: segregation/condensation protein A [Ruminococcus sp.]|uniref:segregation and condensation protein A n=1 Tax=Ruminococcus sp. TaxID=41978 RepID=UPI0025D71F7B|nr:segregation/condensation protein A [Ruminococcus sp.]MCR5600692.1 segregation/condensation protein A [Ruminococcus sp.]